MKRRLSARVPDDLILKVRANEGWPRVEGDKLATIQRMNALYEITTTRDGRYVATRRTDKP
jgi:hypothetical protein